LLERSQNRKIWLVETGHTRIKGMNEAFYPMTWLKGLGQEKWKKSKKKENLQMHCLNW